MIMNVHYTTYTTYIVHTTVELHIYMQHFNIDYSDNYFLPISYILPKSLTTKVVSMTGRTKIKSALQLQMMTLKLTSLLARCMNTSNTSTPCSTVVTVSKAEVTAFCIITSRSLRQARNLSVKYMKIFVYTID